MVRDEMKLGVPRMNGEEWVDGLREREVKARDVIQRSGSMG